MSSKHEPRLKKFYLEKVIPGMMEKYDFKNRLQVPRIEKIVINIGLSEARENVKVVDLAIAELATITGQKPQIRRAKKSISNFKLRKGMPVGTRVTLRGDKMYEFIDRFITVSIPRIRDFHGLELKGFDGQGNYNLGLKEQYIFPEVEIDKSDKARGMNITFVTTAENDDESKNLLILLGMPFKKQEKK
ncbi:MAG: 50S ribosomal protein L5 [Elusimicrobia bacterium]|nr:50S ribosomal protein L5 [Elusimicrobiota bacterium]MBU2614366.1 50S ribosomal protein L5 [Elusimicrobiota bacterium]